MTGIEFSCELIQWRRHSCCFWWIQRTLQQQSTDKYNLFLIWFKTWLLILFLVNQVNVLKPSHKSSLKSKIMGASAVPDSFSAVNNATTRDIESEIELSQEGKVREIFMDNVNSRLKVSSRQIFSP